MRLPFRSRLRRRAGPQGDQQARPLPTLGEPEWTLEGSELAEFSSEDLCDAAQLPEEPKCLPVGMEVVGEGVYAGPLLSSNWCSRLVSELDRFDRLAAANRWSAPPPNSMHQYGFDVSILGIAPAMDALLQQWIAPWASRAYPWLPPLVEQNAFLVDYGLGGDRALGFHVDDSDLTVTLCLEAADEGSELYFEGLRCGLHVDGPTRPGEHLELRQVLGHAIIHPGKNRHGVRPIRAGRRRNLVIWCRSAFGRQRWMDDFEAGNCPDWCGENPRRKV